MNTIVCIKQVPGTTVVDIDPDTGVLKRDGIDSKMNPYDLYALEAAFRLREKLGGKITVLTMGPPQAKAIIKEAYMMGADAGYILSDRRFAGSDVLATSYTLAQGIEQIGDYDLIICGKQTTDGDTAQVGPAIAEHLKIPHVTWVRAIEKADTSGILVEQNMADSYEVVWLEYPCLITVEKDIYTPRLPSYKKMLQTRNWAIQYLDLNALSDTDENHYGLHGSPTQVEQVFQPQSRTEHIIWDSRKTDCVTQLHTLLSNEKFIGENKS
jgi:electron transfer flavoprotein beta subunit